MPSDIHTNDFIIENLEMLFSVRYIGSRMSKEENLYTTKMTVMVSIYK